MADPPLLLAFLAAAAVLTVTPGLDTAIVLRAGAGSGRRAAALAALGVALGCLVWGAAAAFGLGALLRASELGYGALKIAGAAYLAASGVKLLLAPRERFEMGGAARGGGAAAFRQGLLTNLLNPKVGVFYVTLFPQFTPAGAHVGGWCLLLALLHMALALGWFAILIAAMAPMRSYLSRPRVVAMLDRLTGGVLVAFGVRLAVSRD